MRDADGENATGSNDQDVELDNVRPHGGVVSERARWFSVRSLVLGGWGMTASFFRRQQ
jgi:hypothetical protein